jgi:hypothetical protein
MKDDLKTLKAEYLSKHLFEYNHILNLSRDDQTKVLPPMKDDLKTLKVEYLRNHLLDHNQILNLSFDDQIIFLKIFKKKRTSNGRQPY